MLSLGTVIPLTISINKYPGWWIGSVLGRKILMMENL
jgi:hypothetical protein